MVKPGLFGVAQRCSTGPICRWHGGINPYITLTQDKKKQHKRHISYVFFLSKCSPTTSLSRCKVKLQRLGKSFSKKTGNQFSAFSILGAQISVMVTRIMIQVIKGSSCDVWFVFLGRKRIQNGEFLRPIVLGTARRLVSVHMFRVFQTWVLRCHLMDRSCRRRSGLQGLILENIDPSNSRG